jgi:DNA-binding winged helix-turn-helix (wHTH) protein
MAVQDTSGVIPTARSMSFGDARWDRVSRRLTLRGEPVRLPWRLGEALTLLVDARGAVVSKEDLQRQIWGEAHMDDSIVPQCIKSLRRAIDPAPGGASYIETVSRAGYRLAVEVIEDTADVPPPLPSPSTRRRGSLRLGAVLLALVSLAVVGAAYYRTTYQRARAAALVERGYRLLRAGNIPDGNRASSLFREALELVPGFPPATAGLAETAARLGEFTFEPALALARRAVQADPACGECQSTLGYVLGVRMWRWTQAESHLARAVQLDPKRASHRILYAEWLMVNGRLDSAAREAIAATRLEPGESRAWSILSAVRFFQRRYADAIREGERAAALNLHHPGAFLWIYRANMQLGDDANVVFARVREVAARANQPDPADTLSPRYLALLERGGRKAVAEAWLEDVGKGRPREVHRYNRALWYMWTGNPASALDELEAGLTSRPYQMIYTAVDPAFASLHSDPRFQRIVRSLDLAP